VPQIFEQKNKKVEQLSTNIISEFSENKISFLKFSTEKQDRLSSDNHSYQILEMLNQQIGRRFKA
jgi:hypothetical protein